MPIPGRRHPLHHASQVFLAALLGLPAGIGGAGAVGADPGPDFDRDIQPILASRCLACHGAGMAEGGLRLDDGRFALGEREGKPRAIVPGQPAESELMRRVTAADPEERMPRRGPPLAAGEIERLRRWIAAGAAWPPHWAYRPLERPRPPAIDAPGLDRWAINPIDRFVLGKLIENGLTPSPPASRRTLIRRVTFDLTGLPPSPEEIDAFLADGAPGAYERLVDRLLDSPRHGERWARHWMDVVHYAETHGHDQDRPRENSWPYRDYLIRSFNEDKPYARFLQEQIAGDILYPEDPWAVVATGFLAAGPWDESSLRDIREDTIDREVARYLDRDDIVTAVMSTFASATVHCARCHEHKFDPIHQSEYYGLQAVFAGVDKANRAYDPDPEVGRKRRELLALKAELPARRQAADASLLGAAPSREVADWEASLSRAALAWRPLDPVEFRSENGAALSKLPDGSILSSGTRPEKDTTTVRVRPPPGRITGIRIEVLTHESLPHQGPGRQDNGNLHLSELALSALAPEAVPGAASGGEIGGAAAPRRIDLKNPRADFDQEGWSIEKALDGVPATAWGIYPQVGRPHWAVFELAQPLLAMDGTVLEIELRQLHGGGHLIGRLRLSATGVEPPLPFEREMLPAAVIEALAVPPGKRSDRQRAELAAYLLERRLDRELASLPAQSFVYCGTSRFQPDGTFRPAAGPRPVHVLHRGDILQPGPAAEPGALSCVPGLPGRFDLAEGADEGARRAALARWLSDRRNGLCWRSIANRIWLYHFGRGIADTPNDFGHMGSPPTHPELLDWLAAELLECGGSLKRLHRLIVTSAAYRQSSEQRTDCAAVDADNRLYWRMNRSRLDAESIRDAVLAISGSLDAAMGGPSVKQFIQTPGIHVTPNVDYIHFDVDDPANLRRSVYRFIFRTLPDPFMEALDCPDSSQLTPKRSVSITPLQALSMLNDKFMVRQSERLAERAERAGADLEARVAAACRLVLGRRPEAEEARAVAAYAEKHGLANACRFLLNSNEFLFVD